MEALILGAPQAQDERCRREICDACLSSIWIPRPVQDALDEAEDFGQVISVLCPLCALARYGAHLVEMISQQQG